MNNRISLGFGKHYIRYMLSFVAVLLIPLLILAFSFSSRFLQKFYEEVYETVDMELDQILIQTDNDIDQLKSITAKLSIDGTLNSGLRANTPLDLLSIINYLQILISANDYISDIYVILDKNNYVATSSTTWNKDYFYKQNFRLSELARQAFEYEASSISSPSFHTAEELGFKPSDDVCFFIMPLLSDYMSIKGKIVFLVKMDSFWNLITERLRSYNAAIFLRDKAGNTIISMDDSQTKRNEMDHEAIIRKRTSSISGWECTAVIPAKQSTFSQVKALYDEFMITALIALILGCAAISLLTHINYAPIKNLRKKAQDILDQKDHNEITEISNAIDFLSDQKNSLKSRLDENMTDIKNSRLIRLISGHYQSAEDFNMDNADLGLFLGNPLFHISILLFKETTENSEKIAESIRHRFESYQISYCMTGFSSNRLILLTNPESRTDEINLLKMIQDHIKTEYNLMTTIGSGDIVDSTEKIPLSYMEASSALDFRFIKGNGTIIKFNEVVGSNQPDVLYPQKEFEILKNALMAKDYKGINTAVDSLIDILYTHKLPLYLARSISFDMIHMVEKSYGMIGDETNYPFKLTGTETAEDIISLIQKWRKTIKTPQDEPSTSINEIYSYLHSNCLSCSFSVYETAERFGMSLPSFSKFFKDSTGQNVLDYTIGIRMDEAKKLLMNRDLQISEISESVGYYNVSSFTRRFRLKEGVSPTEYRNLYSH